MTWLWRGAEVGLTLFVGMRARQRVATGQELTLTVDSELTSAADDSDSHVHVLALFV